VTAVAVLPRRTTAVPVEVDGSQTLRDTGVRLGAMAGLWASLLLVTYWWQPAAASRISAPGPPG